MNHTTTAADRCRGVLIRLAAGDQIGGPIRMAVRLAESLLESGGFNAADILRRYLLWWRDGAFDTGPVSDRALALMAAGMQATEATAQVNREFDGKTAGCNPAHRSSPLSMLASVADEDLPACAMSEARLTHHDPLAGEVAAVVNMLCRSLIRGVAWDDALRQCSILADQDGPGNNGGYAPDVLQAALFFVSTSSDFSEALKRSLAFAGPANYCPVLVGVSAVLGGEIQQFLLLHWLTSIFSQRLGRPQRPWLRVGQRMDNNDPIYFGLRYASFAGNTLVQISVRPGRTFQVELFHFD